MFTLLLPFNCSPYCHNKFFPPSTVQSTDTCCSTCYWYSSNPAAAVSPPPPAAAVSGEESNEAPSLVASPVALAKEDSLFDSVDIALDNVMHAILQARVALATRGNYHICRIKRAGKMQKTSFWFL
jgi:hypothetical protein